MKVYMFYLTDKNAVKRLKSMNLLESLSVSSYNDSKYFFYGYTSKKKLAKKFESIHDMEKFYLKKVEMEEDEFEEFNSSNRSFHLIQETPLLCGENSHTILPLTSGEEWAVIEEAKEFIYEILCNKCKIDVIPTEIFTNDMYEDLANLGYLRYAPHYETSSLMEYISEHEFAEYIDNNGFENRLGLYIYLYGDIIKINEVLTEGSYEC